MEPNQLCSEDESRTAVCACFCRFPLPTLCRECTSKHPVNPDVFQHFHLPVYASQWISTKELRAQYSTWFFTLHNAYSMLKENEEELTRFEEKVEATRLEAVQQLDLHAQETKQRLASLKESFRAEMRTAIDETKMHAMEQWSPASGSLSSLVWHYNSSDSLKLFHLRTGVGNVKQAVQVSITTSLPALSAFNQSDQDLELLAAQQADQSRKALEDAIRKNDGETEALKREVQQLRERNARLAEEIEELKKSTSAQVLALRDEVKALQGRQPNVSEEDSRTVATALLDRGLAEKAAFKYNESAQSLQLSWDLLKRFSDDQTVAVGIELVEVLGLHLGKVAQAREVQAESLASTRSRAPISEDVMKLNNLGAALSFLNDDNTETVAICRSTLQLFAGLNYSSEHFWVAIFYLTFALCELNQVEQAETVVAEWIAVYLLNETRLTHLLKLSARARLERAKDRNREAEGLLLDAQEIAASGFSTSIYAVLNQFGLGVVQEKMHQREIAQGVYSEAESTFASHFPTSIWAALNLIWLSDLCNDMGQRKVALEKRQQAHLIYEAHFPRNINTAVNLAHLAALYADLGQREVAEQKRLEAHLIYEAHFVSDISTANNLNNLGLLYADMGRLGDAERTHEQARALYSAYHPTSNHAANNFFNLALLHKKKHNIESAISCAKSAFEIWSNNKSADAQTDALPLLSRLRERRS